MAITQQDIDDIGASWQVQLDRIEKAAQQKVADNQKGPIALDLSNLNSLVAKAANVAQQAEDALKG